MERPKLAAMAVAEDWVWLVLQELAAAAAETTLAAAMEPTAALAL